MVSRAKNENCPDGPVVAIAGLFLVCGRKQIETLRNCTPPAADDQSANPTAAEDTCAPVSSIAHHKLRRMKPTGWPDASTEPPSASQPAFKTCEATKLSLPG